MDCKHTFTAYVTYFSVQCTVLSSLPKSGAGKTEFNMRVPPKCVIGSTLF